jgi:hypothetical protein
MKVPHKAKAEVGAVTHACNPHYVSGKGQQDHSLRPAWAKK